MNKYYRFLILRAATTTFAQEGAHISGEHTHGLHVHESFEHRTSARPLALCAWQPHALESTWLLPLAPAWQPHALSSATIALPLAACAWHPHARVSTAALPDALCAWQPHARTSSVIALPLAACAWQPHALFCMLTVCKCNDKSNDTT
jgi:hypothetical protein